MRDEVKSFYEPNGSKIPKKEPKDGFYACPCCEGNTLEETGLYEICGRCGWEDDISQELHPNMAGGANKASLIDARENFKKHGHCDGPVKNP